MVCLLHLSLGLVEAEAEMDGRIVARGYLKNETAYRIHKPRELVKVKNLLFGEMSGKISEAASFKLSGRVWYDAVFDLTDNFPSGVGEDQKLEAQLRDSFLDLSIGRIDLRVGRQQVVWGESLTLFVADVVNAKDLREFILPEFAHIRIPQWAAEMHYFQGPLSVEGVWIPVLEFNQVGVDGSEFEWAGPPLPEGAEIVIQDTQEPPNKLENSEAGLRILALIRGWDLGFFSFYTYDDFPALFRTIRYEPVTLRPIVTYSPRHTRLFIIGGTLSKAVSDTVLRAEFAYHRKKFFPVSDLGDEDGIIRRDLMEYLLGLDQSLGKGADMNLEFYQKRIFSPAEGLAEDHSASYLILRVAAGFWNRRIIPELLGAFRLGEKDFMIRPKIGWEPRGDLQFFLGADLFDGHEKGQFGQFEKKDRVYLEAKYSF
jgi:hypothetical protein